MKVIMHTPDTLAKVVHGLMSEWKVFQVIATIDGKHIGAPEETWVPVGGINMTFFYLLYGVKVHKSSV